MSRPLAIKVCLTRLGSNQFNLTMLRYTIFLLLGTVFVSAIVNPGPEYPPTKGSLWPQAQKQIFNQTYYTYDPSSFHIKATNKSCTILKKVIERYSFIVRDLYRIVRRSSEYRVRRNNQDENYKGVLKELQVDLTATCEEYPSLGMDEQYNLTIGDKSILKSNSIWGIIRGMESWSQLFYLTDDYKELRINATDINDYPRHPHRGLLLDTSRHYISLANILKTLDAMAMNKMNVFHWHIVDDQSFPYESVKFPDLSRLGAYHPSMIYNRSNIKLVIDYARDRGIRVLPEFDVPGHTRSWGGAFPDILTKCYSKGKVIGLGPMDPIKNVTYKLLQELMEEVQELFPEKYLHIGGDEVELDCWSSNPELQDYMKQHNMTYAGDLHSLFMKNVLPLLGDKSKSIVWQEVIDENVPLSTDTIIQVWKWNYIFEMVNILSRGYRLIFSSAWYLDHLKSGGDWTDFYVADPRLMVHIESPGVNLDNILGGEACMWGEVVNDMNVISRVWPRASAVAERLWSPGLTRRLANVDIPSEVYSRLEEHTCRMNRRGIHAQPPNGPGFCFGAIL